MVRTRYDRLTQSLHWATAALVILTYAIGLGREIMPKGDLRTMMMAQHISFGLAMLGVVAVRILWRLAAPPVAPAPMAPNAHLAARFAHMGLYILMLAAPVIGLAAAFIKGRTVGFFGLEIANPLTVNVAIGKALEGAHEWAAHALLALAGLHAAAALGHQYLLRDGVMARMLPSAAQS